MKPNLKVGLNTPQPQASPIQQAPAPVIKQTGQELHRMAMGVAMQNLMKRMQPKNPTGK